MRLTKAGESENPAKAIADMRKATAKRVQKHATKVALANATFDEPEDEDDPGDDAQTIWRRGLINRRPTLSSA